MKTNGSLLRLVANAQNMLALQYDDYRYQKDNGIKITEDFRAVKVETQRIAHFLKSSTN